jgi:hypothetical protein
MGHALGEILPLAVAAAIRPATVVAVVLLLTTPRARSNGVAFAVGFLAGLTVLAAVLLAIASLTGASDSSAPAEWASMFKLVLGVLFLAVGGVIWKRRPKAGERFPMPSWTRAIDRITALQALGLGALTAVLNGKNLMLTAAAVVYVVDSAIPDGEQVVAVAVFVLIAAACVLAPLAVYFLAGDRAQETLAGLREWMIEHTPAIMTTLFLLIGVMLIGDGIEGLSQ